MDSRRPVGEGASGEALLEPVFGCYMCVWGVDVHAWMLTRVIRCSGLSMYHHK